MQVLHMIQVWRLYMKFFYKTNYCVVTKTYMVAFKLFFNMVGNCDTQADVLPMLIYILSREKIVKTIMM